MARTTLKGFVGKRVEPTLRENVQRHLDSWRIEAERASWRNPAELKISCRSASIISSKRVVFNIKGNDYRLVAEIDYEYQIVLVVWLGTHREYDNIDVKEVRYDRKRYHDSPSEE